MMCSGMAEALASQCNLHSPSVVAKWALGHLGVACHVSLLIAWVKADEEKLEGGLCRPGLDSFDRHQVGRQKSDIDRVALQITMRLFT